MPRRRDHDDDRDDDWADDGEDLPEGVYLDPDEDPSVPCPYCSEPVFEGASYCVKCENFISKQDAPADRKPAWVWVCLVIALAIAVLWSVTG
jgi:hypothetical protein